MTARGRDERIEETDNSPRPEDGDQSVVSQRPETLVLEEDLAAYGSAAEDVVDLTGAEQHQETT